MGRLLQTQNRLYSLKKYKPQDFLHGCGRRQGCKLVWKSPTHLWLLPHEDFGKPVLVEELISLELIFVGGKQKFPFSFFALLLLITFASQFKPLATFILLPLDCVLLLLPTLLQPLLPGWTQPVVSRRTSGRISSHPHYCQLLLNPQGEFLGSYPSVRTAN